MWVVVTVNPTEAVFHGPNHESDSSSSVLIPGGIAELTSSNAVEYI